MICCKLLRCTWLGWKAEGGNSRWPAVWHHVVFHLYRYFRNIWCHIFVRCKGTTQFSFKRWSHCTPAVRHVERKRKAWIRMGCWRSHIVRCRDKVNDCVQERMKYFPRVRYRMRMNFRYYKDTRMYVNFDCRNDLNQSYGNGIIFLSAKKAPTYGVPINGYERDSDVWSYYA